MEHMDKAKVKKEVWGGLAIFASAFCFYLCTVIVRLAQEHVSLPASYYTLSRFFLGFFVTASSLSMQRRMPVPREYRFLILRALANLVSVYCFYRAAQVTSAAEANILNMTYPLFIAVISFVFWPKDHAWPEYLLSIIAFAGIVLVVTPGDMQRSVLQAWGLCSGISGAIAVIALKKTRQRNDTETVLVFMFGLGSMIIFIFGGGNFVWPDLLGACYLGMNAFFGVAGQYLMTFGQRYVSAIEGGIISTSRILLAAMLSPLLANEPVLSLFGWLGALMILSANIYLAYRRID